jgi:nucleotide-binding universal stress UspA family protein
MNAPRFRTLLVALDQSPRAPAVLAASVDLARRLEGQLILFRAVGIPLDIPAEALSQAPSELASILEAKARRDLEARAREVPPELFRKLSVKVGIPWEAICRDAREEGADLIVIGSHGFSGIDRLLGTTAGRVVNHADRSVIVVRDAHRAER